MHVQVPSTNINQNSTGGSGSGAGETRQDQQDTASTQTQAAGVLRQQQQHSPSGSSIEPPSPLQTATQNQFSPDQRGPQQARHGDASPPTLAAPDAKRLQELSAAGGAQVQADSSSAQQTAPPREAQEGSAVPPAVSEGCLQQKQDPRAASGRLQATSEWPACLHTVRPCSSHQGHAPVPPPG